MSGLMTAVIELTDRVQAAIDEGDWPRAQEIEATRRQLLEQLAVAPGSGAELASVLAAVEERNQRLIGLVQHHRRRVLREAAVARTANAGAAAYADQGAGAVRDT